MIAYQFAVLRYVHDLATGEFVNFGIALLDPSGWNLLWKRTLNARRAKAMFGQEGSSAMRRLVRMADDAIQALAESLRERKDTFWAVGSEPHSLEGLLKATFSPSPGSIAWSVTMTGVGEDLAAELAHIFAGYIGRYSVVKERERREDKDVKNAIVEELKRARSSGMLPVKIGDVVVKGDHYKHTFAAGWQNGQQQVLDGISLDLAEGARIVEKATAWSGRLYNLHRGGGDFRMTGVVAPPADEGLRKAYANALAILRHAPCVRQIVEERDVAKVIETIRKDVASHGHNGGEEVEG